jgi:hypothetical protein
MIPELLVTTPQVRISWLTWSCLEFKQNSCQFSPHSKSLDPFNKVVQVTSTAERPDIFVILVFVCFTAFFMFLQPSQLQVVWCSIKLTMGRLCFKWEVWMTEAKTPDVWSCLGRRNIKQAAKAKLKLKLKSKLKGSDFYLNRLDQAWFSLIDVILCQFKKGLYCNIFLCFFQALVVLCITSENAVAPLRVDLLFWHEFQLRFDHKEGTWKEQLLLQPVK